MGEAENSKDRQIIWKIQDWKSEEIMNLDNKYSTVNAFEFRH